MKVSVVIPAYNAEKSIGKCVQSVLKQEFGESFEVIVVDDGSSDKTTAVVSGFKEVKLIKQRNKGPASARNAGVESAKGKIIVFVDSDCVAEKTWLREMVLPLRDGNVAGVQGIYRSNQKEVMARMVQLEIEERYEKMRKEKYIDFVGSYSAAYRKDVFNEAGGFDTTFPTASGEDTDLSFKVNGLGHKMVLNPNAVVFHTHPTTLGKYLKTKFKRSYWRTLIYRKHANKIMKDSYTSQKIKIQTGLFYLFFASLVAGIFIPVFLLYSGIFLLLIVASSLPFLVWAIRRDFWAGVFSPAVAILRTAVFSAGLVAGILRTGGR